MANNNFLDYLVYQQLIGGGSAGSSQVWLQVAMLVCLFLVAIFRPEVVRAKPLFRMACMLLALSLLVSPTLNFLLGYLLRVGSGPGPMYGSMSGDMTVLLSFPSVVGSVLFGLSVICGLCSLGLTGIPPAAAKRSQSLTGWGPTSNPPIAQPPPRRVQNPDGMHPLDEPD
jgi:hypothetical protein